MNTFPKIFHNDPDRLGWLYDVRSAKRKEAKAIRLGRYGCVGVGGVAALKTVASALMTLHVAANAEGLSATSVRALERLLTSVRVAVDSQ